MNSFNAKRTMNYRDLLYKALIFIGTVLVIVYFLPSDGKFNYQFDINKPWKYGQLMATFDFPIYKTAEEVRHEQDSILRNFQPYYTLNSQAAQTAINKLRERYNAMTPGSATDRKYLPYIERMLNRVYKQGIMDTDALASLQKDSAHDEIRIVDQKMAYSQEVSRLLSVKQAYQLLLENDTVHYHPSTLRHYGERQARDAGKLLVGERHRPHRAKNYRPWGNCKP